MPPFTPATLAFLGQLRANNNREWFVAHKAEYEANVRDPALALVAQMAVRLPAISPHFVADPRPLGGSLMRIHRDTRFSPDKTPYKSAIAIQFRHRAGGDGAAPGFHLRIEPGNTAVGGGIWRPESRTLDAIRHRIVAEPERWLAVTRGQNLRSACGFIGESLKRVPAGFDPDPRYAEDLKRKDFALSLPLTEADVIAAHFPDVLVAALAETAPFVRFLADACGLAF